MTLKSSQRIIGTGKKTVPQEQQVGNAPILNEAIKVRNHLFVISINDYKFCPPLFNAVKDADDMVRVLTSLYDFDAQNVVKLSNAQATESNIVAQLKAYVNKLSVKDNLLIYYSGHGTYDALIEEGYWVPVDVDFRATTGDIDLTRCLANGMILKYLNAIKSLHTIVIADACFSGSLATQRLLNTGAGRLETIPSRCILTAGRNEPVLDGKPGDNSPFASALISYLEKNTEIGISFTDLGSSVQKAVANNSKQIPICARLQNAGDQNGEFVFHRKEDENTFWAHILRMNAVEGYKGYIAKYPQGLYLKEANAALARLLKPVTKPKANEVAVKQGTILYDVPSKMQLLQEVKCVVRIAFDEVMAKLDFKMTADTELKTMRVSNVMNVEVFDESQQAFAIRTISSSRQFIDSDYFTQWLFYVKPLKEGNYTLLLKVTVVEKSGKEELLREIVLEETVSIVANLPQPEPSRMRAAHEKFILAPPNEQTPVVPPIKPISPKTTTTHTGGTPTTGETKVRVLHVEAPDNAPAPPMPPLQPLAHVGNRNWRIGGGTLAVLLAIFMVGRTIWSSSSSSPSNDVTLADNNRSALPTNPLPASTPTLLSNDTAFAPTVRPTEASKIVKPVLTPVKRPAPVFAEAKPKPKPKQNGNETLKMEVTKTTTTALRKEPEIAAMVDAGESPNAARLTFREPSENVKAVSKSDEEAWRKAKINGEALAYKKYMEEQPKGAYRSFAKERWEGLREMDDWHQVENQHSWENYRKHLEKYPQGRFSKEAMERKNALEARKKEPR